MCFSTTALKFSVVGWLSRVGAHKTCMVSLKRWSPAWRSCIIMRIMWRMTPLGIDEVAGNIETLAATLPTEGQGEAHPGIAANYVMIFSPIDLPWVNSSR